VSCSDVLLVLAVVSQHRFRLRRRWPVQVGGNRCCVLVPVWSRDLPGAAADATKPPAAWAQPCVAEITWTAFTGAVATSNAAYRNHAIKHGLPQLRRTAAPAVAIGAPAEEP
jgi:hypothetical protein